MALKSDPQTTFHEEKLATDLEMKVRAELMRFADAEVILKRTDAEEIIDAQKVKKKAREDIKDLIPLDGQEHRYRVDGHVITIGTERAGGPVRDRKASQMLKIELASED